MKYVGVVALCLILAVGPVYAHGGDEPPTVEETLIHLVHLLGLSLVLGSIVFQAIVSRDRAAHRELAWVGWALMGGAGLLLLFNQGGVGVDLTSKLNDPDNLVLGDLRFGSVWLLRLLLWLMLGGALLWLQRLPLLAGVLTLLTAALNEIARHPPSLEDTALMVATDLVIQIAFAVVFGLGTQAIRLTRRERPTLRLNRMAMIACVCALAVLIALIIQRGYPDLIAVQIGALIVLCGLLIGGLFLGKRLPLFTAAQMAVAAGVLQVINPFTYSRLQLDTTQLEYEVQITNALSVSLEIYPALPGQNTVYVTLIDSQIGTRVDDASRVSVTASLLPPLDLVSQGDGVYSAEVRIEASGTDTAQVLIQRPGSADTMLDYPFTIGEEIEAE